MRRSAGIPYELGIIRNHYVGRTFIEPTQQIRQLGVRLKHSAQPRGGERQAHRAGRRFDRARHHLDQDRADDARCRRDAKCISASPRRRSRIRTIYGIDTPERDKLLAATHTLEEMRRFIGADSLAFLSVDGIYRAMGDERRDPERPQFTDHCFTGDYPTPLTDQRATRARSHAAAASLSPARAEGELTLARHDEAILAGPYRARHRRLARHRPRDRARAGEGRRACGGDRPHRRRARRARRRDQGRGRLRDARAARPEGLRRHRPARRSRSTSATASSTCWWRMPACSARSRR